MGGAPVTPRRMIDDHRLRQSAFVCVDAAGRRLLVTLLRSRSCRTDDFGGCSPAPRSAVLGKGRGLPS